MSKFRNFVSLFILAFSLFSCPSGSNNYSAHRSGYKPDSKAVAYQIYPMQSQLFFSVYPQIQGAPALVRANIEKGTLYAEGDELRGGEVAINMGALTLEMPEALPDNTNLSDLKGKNMFGTAAFGEATAEIAKITSAFNEKTGSTHLIALNLKLRKKNRGLQVPARIIVNKEHIALMSVGVFKVDLTEWGMRPEGGGWQKEAVLSLQIRGDLLKK
jgi:hypothetical protein